MKLYTAPSVVTRMREAIAEARSANKAPEYFVLTPAEAEELKKFAEWPMTSAVMREKAGTGRLFHAQDDIYPCTIFPSATFEGIYVYIVDPSAHVIP